MAKQFSDPAKKKAWKEFARFIRVRDCIKTRNIPFSGVCITCGNSFHISFLQAGHHIPGRSNAVLFSEEGVNAQCKICNEGWHVRPGSRAKAYRKAMIERHGKAKVEQMIRDSKKIIHNRDMDFPAIAKKYKEKTTELVQRFGYKDYDQMMAPTW